MGVDSSEYPPRARALTDDQWRIVCGRKMVWALDASKANVILNDPTTGRVATKPTLKMAYDEVMP